MAFTFFPRKEIKAHWLTLSFEPDLEAAFLDEHFKKSISHVRLSLLLGVLFYALFGILDAWVFPETKFKLWFIRFGIFAPFSFAVLGFSYTRYFKKYMQLALASVVLVAGLGIIAMIVIAPDPGSYLYYAGLILVYLYGYTFFKLRFIWATATGWTIVVAYEIAAIWLTETPLPVLINNNFFCLTGNLFGMFASYAIEFYSRQDFIRARMLQAEREKVDEANRELERRVAERTAQLVDSNLKLKQEIEERFRVAEALRESEQRFRSLSENAPDIIFTLDRDGVFTYVNPAWQRLLGHRPVEVLGRNFAEILRPDATGHFLEPFKQVLEDKKTFSDVEGDLVTKDGLIRHFSVSGSPNFDSSGNAIGMVGLMKDITVRKMSEEQIKYIAYHDPLTGLHNRKAFYERLEETIVESGRRKSERWALLFIDLDRFKDVNDTLGHEIGDELLKETAARLKACLRKSDHVFRLGGDEFTIITTQMSEDIVASMVAQRILDAVSRPFYLQGHEIYMTGSIGISVHPDDGDTVEVLVKNADMAMYAAKEDTNSYRFFTAEMNERALERMRVDRSLRQALELDQLRLFYQPMVDQEYRVVGMEALIRWEHPEMGLIMPKRFIYMAEETGTIIPIGEWVLRTACTQAKKWREELEADIYVSVNLSARQFRQPNLVETVIRILKETGLPPESLMLELTETGIMDDPEDAVEKMKTLNKLGIRFSIDDFGTGYSSLSYLKRFPVDTLKIDRSFIKDATHNQEDQEIVRTIISMAKNLRMEPLAEGVENSEQKDFLRSQGCRMMQGYYFGRPMPESDFTKLLAKHYPRRVA